MIYMTIFAMFVAFAVRALAGDAYLPGFHLLLGALLTDRRSN